MSVLFTNETKTGDIVTKFPAASKLFKEYQIDFCCGGNRPIGEIIKDQQLEDKKIITLLNTLYEQANLKEEMDWTKGSFTSLVEHIKEKYHQQTRELLDELEVYVSKVYNVHGDNEPHLKDMFFHFFLLKDEMEQHLLGEEQAIFPHILAYDLSQSENSLQKAKEEIAHLEAEHEGAGDLLKKIRQDTSHFQLPTHACNTYQLTYLKLQELESMTFDHIHLENNILFKRIEKA